MDKLNGYKTYAIAGATLLYAIGGAVSGHLTADQAIQLVLGSGAIASLRHGIEKK
jgi:hypothetical protein